MNPGRKQPGSATARVASGNCQAAGLIPTAGCTSLGHSLPRMTVRTLHYIAVPPDSPSLVMFLLSATKKEIHLSKCCSPNAAKKNNEGCDQDNIDSYVLLLSTSRFSSARKVPSHSLASAGSFTATKHGPYHRKPRTLSGKFDMPRKLFMQPRHPRENNPQLAPY